MQTPRYFRLISRLAMVTSLSLLCFTASDGSAGTYRDSAHGGSNDPTFQQGAERTSTISNPAGNCAHCHEQHATLGGSGPADYLLFDTLAGNVMCTTCHSSTPLNNADDLASQFVPAKTAQHDPNSALGLVECGDCHNSHVAQNITHDTLASTNLVGSNSPLLSVVGTSVSAWVAGVPPGGGFEALGSATFASANPITMEYQLCFKCHSGLLDATALNLNVYTEFNPNNAAVHPVATEGQNWKNLFLIGNPGALNPTWNGANRKIYCSDCHGSETVTDPQGPHGSTIKYMLKAGNPVGVPPNLDALCLICHQDPSVTNNSGWNDPNPLGFPQWGLWVNPPYPGFVVNPRTANQAPPAGPHSLAQHVPPANPAGCIACHGGTTLGGAFLASNIHGANYLWPMVGAYNGATSTAFLLPDAGGAYITQNYYNQGLAGQIPGNRRCVTGPGCHVNAPWNVIGYLY